MTPRPTRIVRSSLLKKGFIEKECGTHRKLHFAAGSKAAVRTYYSHGAKECDDYILGQMAIHLKLSRAQLDDLIDCTLSGESYVEILRGQGLVRG
jgi:hypothetical protein